MTKSIKSLLAATAVLAALSPGVTSANAIISVTPVMPTPVLVFGKPV